jgi:hypothetical protein
MWSFCVENRPFAAFFSLPRGNAPHAIPMIVEHQNEQAEPWSCGSARPSPKLLHT